MNYIFKSAFLITVILLFIRCDTDGNSDETIHGNGVITEFEHNVSGFSQITMQGAGNIYISQTDREKVKVRTDENLQPEIEASVSGNSLLLTSSGKSISPTVLDYFIELKDLNSLSILGAGNMECTYLNIDDLRLSIEGAGNIGIDSIDASDIELQITGGGRIGLKGNTTTLSANIEGSGYINCDSLVARDVFVIITGTGDVKVFATENLNATITGAGRVFYRGEPLVKSTITGVGEVTKIK